MPIRKLAILLLFALDILGCSKSTQPASTAPASTIIAVSVSCSSVAILSSQTASCTATVQGTGAYNSGVTWSAVGGTVSSSGLVTPSGAGTIAVTATSTQDPSKAGSNNVLSVAPATLAGLSPVVISAGPADLLSVTGSGYTASSQIQIDGTSVATNFVSAGQLTASLKFQTAGSHQVAVVNVSPVASTSVSINLQVLLPVLNSLSPTAATPGTALSLNVSGMDTSAASNNILRFTQGGVTFDAPANTLTSNGTDANGLPAAILTTTLPSAMAPTSKDAAFGVPAIVSMIVDGVSATGTTTLLAEPPSHGLELVPASTAPGSAVQVVGLGAFTHFSSSTVFTVDTGLSLSNIQIDSGTQFTSTLAVSPAAVTGSHTLTATTGSETVKFPFTVVLASPSAPVLTTVSVGSGTPMTPITLTGSGFSGVGQAASSFALRYTYGTSVLSVPAVPNSDTQVSTYIPPLYDSSSGVLYSGPLSLSVVVNGQASTSLPLTLLVPPANASPIGTSTLAYLDDYKQMLNNANTQASNNPAFTAAEIASMVSVNTAVLNSLATFRAAVVSAVGTGTATLSDGTVITQSAINTFDIFLQQSAVQKLAPQLQKGILKSQEAVAHPLSAITFTDSGEKDAANACRVSDAFGLATSIFSSLSSASCLLAFIPVVAPVCAASQTISQFATIASDLASLTCDALPVNMQSVAASPSSVTEPISASATLEAPTGTFGQSPALIADGATDVASLIAGKMSDKVESYFESAVPSLVANGKVYVDTLFDALETKIEDEIGIAANTTLTSPLGYSQQVNLTSNTTALLPNASGQLVTNGLSFSPGTRDGITTLQLDLSSFRLINSSGSIYFDSTLVPGNQIPVTIQSVVVVSPSTVTVAAGAQQQFSANVIGTTNQGVTWSVDNLPSGNSTVGTISVSGLYAAPSTLANHVITATSQSDNQAGTAQVQMTVGVSVSPASAQLQINSTQTFTGTVLGTGNTALSWALQEGSVAGTFITLSPTSVRYNAPATEGTYHLVATLVSDPTKTATATIVVTRKALWPMSGHDAQRSGQANYAAPTATQIANGPRWSFPSGAAVVGDVTVSSEGEIYFASDKLYALNSNGTQFATPASPGQLATGPAIDDVNGFIYVGVKNTDSTFDIWRFTKTLSGGQSVLHIAPAYGGLISPLILGLDGTLYVTSGRFPGVVYALGNHTWSTAVCPGESGPVPASAVNAPALGSDGSVYVMCSGNYTGSALQSGLNKLDPLSGTQIAFSAYQGDATEPVIDGIQHVHAGYQVFGGASYCGGYDEWNSSLAIVTPTTVYQCAAYTTGRASILTDGNSTVRIGYSYAAEHDLTAAGAYAWTVYGDGNPNPSFTSIPTVDPNGTIVVGTSTGIAALSQSNGSFLWTYSVGTSITTQPVITASGSMYVGSSNGIIYAF